MLSANKRSTLIYGELVGGSQTDGSRLKKERDLWKCFVLLSSLYGKVAWCNFLMTYF